MIDSCVIVEDLSVWLLGICTGSSWVVGAARSPWSGWEVEVELSRGQVGGLLGYRVYLGEDLGGWVAQVEDRAEAAAVAGFDDRAVL